MLLKALSMHSKEVSKVWLCTKLGQEQKINGVGEVEQAKECLPPYPTILKNSLTEFSQLSSLTDWQQQVLNFSFD